MTIPGDLKRQIEQQLANRPGGLRRAELRRMVGATSKQATREFAEVLRELVRQGTVIKRGRGRYGLLEDSTTVVGILSVHPRGFGFVERGNGRPDLFIPPSRLLNAFPGDRVRARLTEETDKGPAGTIETVLERGHSTLTGEYCETGPNPIFRPMRRDFPEQIPLLMPKQQVSEPPVDGDWIAAEILFPDNQFQGLRARFKCKLNDGNGLDEDMDAIVSEFGLPPPYTREQQLAAEDIEPRAIERADHTALAAITIDPPDAKDFDDAISIETKEDPEWVSVGVHIADVAAFVAAGSQLDTEARRRGFTAYLPGRTLPMLPKPLAADLCSLKEGTRRPAHSVFLEISRKTGAVRATCRLHTWIRVAKRLTFEEVEGALAGKDMAGCPPDVAQTVMELGRLSAAMRENRRQREEFLEIATTEVRVIYEDEPPAIVGFQESRPNPAHQLVEEFMLAANVAVAEEFLRESVPAIFRVHESPQPSDITVFKDWARNALSLKTGRLDSRRSVNDFLRGIDGHRAEQIVLNGFLRALPRATYSSTCGEHFGLGKQRYSHFTSPIRRYADLTIHQQLWLKDTAEPLLSSEECDARAREVTAIEAINDEAYYAALDRAKIRYLNQRRASGEKVVYEAIVAKVTVEGLLLYLPELGLMGFMPKQMLPEDNYVFSARTMSLHGRHNSLTFRCGDALRVRPKRADVARGELTLRPV